METTIVKALVVIASIVAKELRGLAKLLDNFSYLVSYYVFTNLELNQDEREKAFNGAFDVMLSEFNTQETHKED